MDYLVVFIIGVVAGWNFLPQPAFIAKFFKKK